MRIKKNIAACFNIFVLTLLFVFVLAACGRKESKSSESSPAGEASESASDTGEASDNPEDSSSADPAAVLPAREEILKDAPEVYDYSVLISINPSFLLYMNGQEVFRMDPQNDDAKSIMNEIPYENRLIADVFKDILNASYDHDFLKDGSDVDVKVLDSRKTETETNEILNETEKVAGMVSGERKIKINLGRSTDPAIEFKPESGKDEPEPDNPGDDRPDRPDRPGPDDPDPQNPENPGGNDNPENPGSNPENPGDDRPDTPGSDPETPGGNDNPGGQDGPYKEKEGYHKCTACGTTGICDRCGGKKTMKCGQCNGTGKEPCGKCGGDGLVDCSCGDGKCWNCKGSGTLPCDTCDGSDPNCPACHGTGRKQCNSCTNGECTQCGGKTYTPCDQCGGTGGTKCNLCKGKGIEKCNGCDGTGICKACNGEGYVKNN